MENIIRTGSGFYTTSSGRVLGSAPHLDLDTGHFYWKPWETAAGPGDRVSGCRADTRGRSGGRWGGGDPFSLTGGTWGSALGRRRDRTPRPVSTGSERRREVVERSVGSMAPGHATLLPAGGGLLLLLLVAVVFVAPASGCDRGVYEQMIDNLCFTKFQLDMRGLERGLWCSWPDAVEIYEALTNCSHLLALRMDCYWPNQAVDRFFVHVHQVYFQDCARTGRLLHDPPPSVLGPFIAVPVLVTLLMTALVVWRSKRTEGVL